MVTSTGILDGLRLLARHGGVVEVRMLKTSKATVSGYFDNPEALVKAVAPWDGKTSIYITANPVAPALLARAQNRLREFAHETTSDADIVRRVWLLTDFDPARPAGISATSAEVEAALRRRDEVVAFLRELGFAEPAEGMSGNGGHALWAVDLPNDEATRQLFERALKALKSRFQDNVVHVDEAVFNAARIWKLYGTVACKGDPVPDRPHRRAELERVPAELIPVDRELLAALAGMAPGPSRTVSAPHGASGPLPPLDLVGAFQARGWYKRALHGGKHAVACPWASEHSGESGVTESCLFEPRAAGEPWGFDCRHAHCAERTIKDILVILGVSRNGQHAGTAGVADREDPLDESTTAGPRDAAGWPRPEAVDGGGLLPVPAFDARRLLPATFAPWVHDIAERAQCPPDFVGVAAIVAAAALVGRRVAIRPKRHDDWTVVPNLWGVVLGPPGIMKTPAVSEALRPLQRLVAEARETYEAQLVAYRFQQKKAKAQHELLQGRLKEALKRGGDTADLEAEFRALELDPPTERRYLVNDTTVEKLGELLNENPNGLLLHRDELSGFLRTMDREGHENDRAFYCEAWNGTGPYTYDRIGRGTVRIAAACVSLLGGLQPGPLVAYLREAFGHGKNDDGLIQRAQLAVWPDRGGEWRNVDRWPDTEAKTAAFEVFRRLAKLDAEEVGATRDGALPFLRFTPEGQDVFDAWRRRLEGQLRDEAEHPVLISHLAKYRSLMPALALLFHLVDGAGGPVSTDAAEQATSWCAYLEPHARRIYQSVTAGAQVAAAQLAAKIQAGQLANPFRARTVTLKGWSGLSEPEQVSGALDLLEERHWLRRVQRPATVRGGRPTVEYEINPKTRDGSVGFAGASPCVSVAEPDSSVGFDGASGGVSAGSHVGPRAGHVNKTPPPPPPPETSRGPYTQGDQHTKPTKPAGRAVDPEWL